MPERIDAQVRFFATGEGGRETAPPADGSYRAFLKAPDSSVVLSRLVAASNLTLGADTTTTWELIAPLSLIDPEGSSKDWVSGRIAGVVPALHFKALEAGAPLTISEGTAAIGIGRVVRRYSTGQSANAV